MSLKIKVALLSFIFLLSLGLHKNILTTEIQGVHAWRQCQTMWNVRNFVRNESNILNPRVSAFNGGKENILRYEFPLMQYLLAQTQKVFGESVIVTRLFLFCLSIATLLGFFSLIRLFFKDDLTAIITTFLFQFSPLFYFYSFNPMPDNMAFCGAIWYLVFLKKFHDVGKLWNLIIASVMLLIATLCKLPFLMFSIVSIVLIILRLIKKENFLQTGTIALIQAVILIPAFSWYIWVLPSWSGNSVLGGIFINQLPLQEYKNIINYHLYELFPKILLYPSTWLFFVIGILFSYKGPFKKNWLFIIPIILITMLYLLLELNAINAVHDYYMIPFLAWIYIPVAHGIFLILKMKDQLINIFLALIILVAPINTFRSTQEKWSWERDNFNNDVYENRKILQDIIPDDELCIILNDRSCVIFSYNIDKMGHCFYNDDLPIDWIGDMIDNYGVTHLYSDSRKIDQDADFVKYVDSLLLSVGSVRVYRLRPPNTESIKHLPAFKKK